MTLPDQATISYAYDMAGRLIQITDLKGRSTQLDYDRLGRIHRLTDPAGNPVRPKYDPLDDLTALTDPIGTRTIYVHDESRTKLINMIQRMYSNVIRIDGGSSCP